MWIKRRSEAYRHCLPWAVAASLCGGAATSWAQTGGPDAGAGPSPPLAADPAPPAANPPPAADHVPPEAAPPLRAAQALNIEDGIRTTYSSPDVLSGPHPGSDLLSGSRPDDIRPANPAPDRSAGSEVVNLVHAKVVDTARLEAADTSVSLFGIEGLTGEPARRLQDFLATDGDQVTCRPQSTRGFICLTPDGSDVAKMALVNGAARTSTEAPDSYREQELAAQAARRGIWASLPPPPDTLMHPVVRDTATLLANDRTYVLDGIVGFGGVYASQLQGYIAAHGDTLTCSPQGAPEHYICVLPDGTDIAMVALANGAAQIAQDTPDAYRLQQADAINNRRGYWLSVAEPVRIAALPPPDPTPYPHVLPTGDDGADGIRYVAGAPVAVIDAVPVFLAFTAGLGWGYYDHFHRWRPAPERYRVHMERFHPEGRGLRGYGDSAMHPGFRPGPAGFGPPRHAGPIEPWAHPGPAGGAPLGGHPLPGGWVHTVTPGAGPRFQGRPSGSGFHPGMFGPPAVGRPGPGGPVGVEHPGVPGAGFHPGVSGPAFVGHADPFASHFHPAPVGRSEPPGSGFRGGLTGPGPWSHAGPSGPPGGFGGLPGHHGESAPMPGGPPPGGIGGFMHTGAGGGFHPSAPPPAMHPNLPPAMHAAPPMSHGSPPPERRHDDNHHR